MTVFAPNGIITYEECLECREPDIKVEHGKDIYGYPMHFEHCPDCGDSMIILCFECPNCKEAKMRKYWKYAERYNNPPAMREPKNPLSRIEEALDLTASYGGIEGNHHKTWVIDQVVRILCGTDKKYKKWVQKYQQGEDGPETYSWEIGIAP